MNPPRNLALLIAVLLCSTCGLLRADEQTSTYRLLGLFEPSRQTDFRELLTSAIPELQVANIDFDKDEVTLRYELAGLFPDGKVPKDITPEKLTERLGNLISSKSKGTFKVIAPSALPADQQARVDIKIGILDCRGCRYGAYQIIAKIDGVEHASVNAETSTITAWIDPAKTNREALEAALKKSQIAVLK